MVNIYKMLHIVSLSQTYDWNIKQFFNSRKINSLFELRKIGEAITRCKDHMIVEDDKVYKRITIKTNCGGVLVRDEVVGREIKTRSQYYVKAGQLAVSKIDARNGAFGIVPPEADGAIITGNFWVYNVNLDIANIDYLILLLSSKTFVQHWQDCSNGSGNRLYLQEEKFLNYKIPMPSIDVQNEIVNKYNLIMSDANKELLEAHQIQLENENYLLSSLGIQRKLEIRYNSILHTVSYKDINQWGYDKIGIQFPYEFKKYNAFSFSKKPSWMKEIYRGKSPVYDESGINIVLNQRCNRWDEINTSFAKPVKQSWFEKIDKSVLTKENDIIVNSTGEGTLGRASLIKNPEHIGLAYDSHMLLLRVNLDEINPQLIVDIINSSFGQEQVNMYKSAQATKQTELGIENLKKIMFPLPELILQNEISEYIKSKKQKVKKLLLAAEMLSTIAKSQFEEAIFDE